MNDMERIETRLRLIVSRSHKHLEALVFQPGAAGRILLQRKDRSLTKPKAEAAKDFGTRFGAALKTHGTARLIFDRRTLRYHGRIKAFIEGLRAAGIEL